MVTASEGEASDTGIRPLLPIIGTGVQPQRSRTRHVSSEHRQDRPRETKRRKLTPSNEDVSACDTASQDIRGTSSGARILLEEDHSRTMRTASRLTQHRGDRGPSANSSANHGSDSVRASHLSRTSDESASTAMRTSRQEPNSNRRMYRYINRVPAAVNAITMREKWVAEVAEKTDGQIRQMSCCTKLQCFKRTNTEFLRRHMIRYRNVNSSQRRYKLMDMLDSRKVFMFDGKQVCSAFLEKAFRFSRDLQSSVRRTCAGRTVARIPNVQEEPARLPVFRNSIISFLTRTAERSADRMPDTKEVHLPFQRKIDVYTVFLTEFRRLHKCTPPLLPYFLRTWKHYCQDIKLRKVARFTKCSTCDELTRAIRDAIERGVCTDEIRAQKSAHVNMIMAERRLYYKKREESTLEPTKSLSIIVDGADQSSFGLPHFTTTTKDVTGHSLKVKLVGLLEHGTQNALHLFTLTEEHDTGSSHIVETLHRFLNKRHETRPFPPTLYIQLDNCSRENKNRYLFAYLECLVCWGLFKSVEASFLPVGHTHEDIDQAFSRTAEQLRHHEAVTLSDLTAQVKQVYNKSTTVSEMRHVANWRGLCEETGCLEDVEPFSSRRYFKFTRSSEHPTDNKFVTSCHVRHTHDGEWVCLKNKKSKSAGFILYAPDLQHTPNTVTKRLTEKNEVIKRIQSEDVRINDNAKRRSLYELVEHVFTQRSDPFHWDLATCIEAVGICGSDENVVDKEGDEDYGQLPTCVDEMVRNDYDYDTGSFVAVRPERGADALPFWLGRVEGTERNAEGINSILSLTWYMLEASQEAFSGKYSPAVLPGRRRRAWMDKVSTDAVLMNFADLTTRGTIPALVQRRLRSSLNM